MVAFVLSTYEWKSSIDEDIVHTYMSAGPLVFLYPLRFVRLHMSVGRCLLPVKHAVIHISLIARKALQLGMWTGVEWLGKNHVANHLFLSLQVRPSCSPFLP